MDLHIPLICHRCAAELEPGKGDFYVVRIEAFADPTPPEITQQDLEADLTVEIDRLIEQMREMGEQDLADQVHRYLTIHLCGGCYAQLIEDPTGSTMI